MPPDRPTRPPRPEGQETPPDSNGDANGGANGGGTVSTVEPEWDATRVFKNPGTISDSDLRVDVAKVIANVIAKSDRHHLESKSVRVRSGVQIKATRRDRTVMGDWHRHAAHGSARSPGSMVSETVHGRVDLKSAMESEAIIGGAYSNFVTGGFLRMAFWVDSLIWGGWLEVDVTRVEVCGGAMIRSYMAYAHAVGARVTAAGILIDDFSSRVEIFGVCSDNCTGDSILAAPGGGVSMEV